MFRPDLSADAFLRRHQNPAGMILRGAVLFVLIIALWAHWTGLIFLLALIELANWLFMPEQDNPPEWLEQILDAEFALLDMPKSGLRTALAATLGIGGAFFALGLWAHHFATTLFGLLLILTIAATLRFVATR